MRIYVAGKITSTNPLVYLQNTMAGITQGLELYLKGYSVFIPHLEIMMWMILGKDVHLTNEMIYERSLEWLKVCDAMLVLPGWEDSVGTKGEIEFALANDIPIYYSVDELGKKLPL